MDLLLNDSILSSFIMLLVLFIPYLLFLLLILAVIRWLWYHSKH